MQLHFITDGHGQTGVDIVNIISVDYPFILQPMIVKALQQWEEAFGSGKILVEQDGASGEQPPTRWDARKLTHKLFKEALRSSFEEMHKKIMLQKFKFNITLSGATLSALLVDPEEDWIYCAGVGNSKVLLLQLDRSWQMSKFSPSENEVSDPV